MTCSDIFGAWGTQWLDELPLPQPYSWKVASLRQLTGWLTSEITVLEQVTADLLAGHDGYRAVQELPGIGVPGGCGHAELARGPGMAAWGRGLPCSPIAADGQKTSKTPA